MRLLTFLSIFLNLALFVIEGCGNQEAVTVTAPAVTVTTPTHATTSTTQTNTTSTANLPAPPPAKQPVTMTGSGNKTSGGIPLQAGPAKVTMQYNGSGNFALFISDAKDIADETYEDTIANKIGSYNDSKMINVSTAGTYYFEVQSNLGGWSIAIEQ